MAVVIGTSGAWKDVYEKLTVDGLPVAHPREIRPGLDKIKAEYPQTVAQFPVDVANEIATFEGQVLAFEKVTQQQVAQRRTKQYYRLEHFRQRLISLQEQRGILRRFVNRLWIKAVEHQRKRFLVASQIEICGLQGAVVDKHAHLEKMKNNKAGMIAERKATLDARIGRLEQILTSKELAGAQAEIEVIEHLSRLPDTYHVFNDVRLEADHFMRFEGEPLQSAQIDHVVLAPNGVFVIEVKNWSRDFATNGDHFNPYTQAARAGFLCKVLLRDRDHQVKVRSVIATRGSLPARRDDQWIKVIPPQNLVRYITWFKDPAMEWMQRDQVVEFFRERLGNSC